MERALALYFKSAKRPRIDSSVSNSFMKMSDSRRLFDSFNFKFSCSILLLSVTPHYRDDKLVAAKIIVHAGDQEQYFSFLTPEVLSFKDGLNLES